MIGYVTLGTDDLDRSRAFYDALFAELGASRLMELDSGFTLYGTGWGKPGVAVTRPYDGEPARAGNGNMVSLVVDGATRSTGSTPRRWSWAEATRGRPGCAARKATAPSTAAISGIRTATSSACSAWGRPKILPIGMGRGTPRSGVEG